MEAGGSLTLDLSDTAMKHDPISLLLDNYRQFTAKIDLHIQGLEQRYAGQITCKKGCDQCCTHLSLLPVEACSLSLAFLKADPMEKKNIIHHLGSGKDQCPLLIRHVCVLYDHRPIICRTHGYPMVMKDKDGLQIDFCEKNFKGMTSFKKSDLLDIETVNTTLIAVNQHFLKAIDPEGVLPERITVADALFLLEDD